MKTILWCCLAVTAYLSTVDGAFGFGGHDKYNDRMLLSEISALTLYNGKMTNARRSSAVPQLKCVGGTAANEFTPQVVQCYNRGGDGYDVQWECKTDMDNAYRFGKVEVTCEGFDHPDDPYILRGSCGLEYTLDLTMEGHMNKQNKHHDYYGNHGNHDPNYHHRQGHHGTGPHSNRFFSVCGDLVLLCIVGLIIYAIYKTCIADRSHDQSYRSPDRGNRPPPPGFRSDYMPPNDGDSCSSSHTGNTYGTQQGTQPAGGGFWTGAFTGGILGYMMGNRNDYGGYGYSRPHTTYHRPSPGWGSWFGGRGSSYSSGFGSGGRTMFGGGGGGTMFGGGGGGSSSSGTRTASGFGGTKRR